MKQLEEIKIDQWQTFINQITQDDTVVTQVLTSEDDLMLNKIIYVYQRDGENITDSVSFSNPDLISVLYKNNIDITMPLNQLKYDYIEMEKTNTTLFEFVMEINRIIKMNKNNMENKDNKTI
jgi:hypothetical protein